MIEKHAFLIMAHNNVDLLKKSLKLLDDPRNDIYIHWDLRSKVFPEQELRASVVHSKIRFVPRIRVVWGGYSQIACELLLLESAVGNGPYAYYHLLSGVDIVLKTPDEFHLFFDKHRDTQFITIYPNPEKFTYRYRYYHFFPDSTVRKRGRPHMVVLYILESMSLFIQKMIGVDRTKGVDRQTVKGDNWFSVTEDCVLYVLSKKKWIRKCFKMSRTSDELFLPMLLWDSKYRIKIFNGGVTKNQIRGSLRLIDWDRGEPYVWRSCDYDELTASPCLFARKFDPGVDADIIDRIISYVEARNREQNI